MQVVFSNAANTSVSLHVPRDYHTSTTVTLTAGEARVFGTFTRPSGARNMGLREVIPLVSPTLPPPITLVRSSQGMLLQWPSEQASEYQPQSSTNLVVWINLTPDFQPGTGNAMTFADTVGGDRRLYRIVARKR